jgi:hypothetical protein
VIKTEISRMPVIESPCCEAPSTSLIRRERRVMPNGDGRCVRCRQPFCRIDISESPRQPLKPAIGARA